MGSNREFRKPPWLHSSMHGVWTGRPRVEKAA
jgi:hypothetical protein